MKKIIEGILRFKYVILVIFIGLSITGGVLQQNVEVNDNMLDYLPKDVEGVVGKNILDETFADSNESGSFYLLVRDTNELELSNIVNEIDDLEEVSSIGIEDSHENDYLLNIVLSTEYDEYESFSQNISNILEEYNVWGGVFSNTTSVPDDGNSGMIVMLFIALAILILVFTKSYFDVVIILGSLSVAIMINMGSNIIFGEISSVSASAAVLIQLAVSIDYTLFIINNYKLRREQGDEVNKAIKTSVAMSFKPVLAGAITTIAGFVALMFMKLGVGRDLGFVLSKGIFISLITALVLVPVLIKICNKAIDKTTHKPLLPSFKVFGKITGKSVSIVVAVGLIIIVGLASIGRNEVDYVYGETTANEYELYYIENFSIDNTAILVIENNGSINTTDFIDGVNNENDLEGVVVINKELVLQQSISKTADEVLACITLGSFNSPECIQFQAFSGFLDTQVDKPTLVGMIQSNQVIMTNITEKTNDLFVSTINGVTYETVLIKLYDPANLQVSDDIFNQIKSLRTISLDEFGEDAWITGDSVMVYDLKQINEIDYPVVSIISLIAVGLVIMFAFKSLLIPLILLTLIQGAIWINLASSYVFAEQLIFMGAIIVGSIQLGASIDYSILLTEKYEYYRFEGNCTKKEAIIKAVEESSHSIITSGLALTIGGYIMFFTQTGTIQQMGMLLGRGAFISMIISLVVAPHILYLFDKLLKKEHHLKTRKQ